MLKQRIITASIMALVFLTILFFFPLMLFAMCFGILLVVGVWEWSDLGGLQDVAARITYTLVSITVALVCGWATDWAQNQEHVRALLVGACLWWALSLLWIQGFPSSSVIWGSRAVRLAMGLMVFIPAWLAGLYLRNESSGAWLVFFVVLLVAAADIGAYFTGRSLGRRKLAPAVSPGKSWEGVFGGVAFAMLVAVGFNLVFGGHAWLSLFVIVVPTALMSVVGDLLESMLKRYRGVKDSSALLPGHGGVLDRIDGLVAATPVFALMLTLSQWRI